MPPSSRKKKVPQLKPTWELCSLCNCFYYSVDQDEHIKKCKEIEGNGETGQSYLVRFVNKGRDNGTLVDRYRVFMNLETLRILSLELLDKVIINDCFIATVECNPEIKTNLIGFANIICVNYIKDQEIVKVSKLDEANTVNLSKVELFVSTVKKSIIELPPQKGLDFLLKRDLGHICLRKSFKFFFFFVEHYEISVTSVTPENDEGFHENKWFQFVKTTEITLDYSYKKQEILEMNFDVLSNYPKIKNLLLHLAKVAVKYSTPKKCLMSGPHGCGKSACGKSLQATFPSVSVKSFTPFEVVHRQKREGKGHSGKLFHAALEGPGLHIIFIDDLDLFCGNRATGTPLCQFVKESLEFLFAQKTPILFIGSSLTKDDFPRDFLSDFSCIAFESLTRKDRFGILSKQEELGGLKPEEMSSIADICHGFQALDMQLLGHRAQMMSLEENPRQKKLIVTKDHLLESFRVTKSMVDEIVMPTVQWEDIVGYDDLKLKVSQAIEWPIMYREGFQRLGLTPQKGLLLYGPPGCCKTMIANAIATNAKHKFIPVRATDIFSRYVGQSEQNIRDLFTKARSLAPSLIFIDEIDGIVSHRAGSENKDTGAILAAFLTEMSGLADNDGVFVLAATNRPFSLDQALLRPGRLCQSIYVPLPCPKTRRAIFEKRFKTLPILPDVDIACLVEKTARYSGDEIEKICRAAGMKCINEGHKSVQMRHFLIALESMPALTDDATLEYYERFQQLHLK